MARSNTCSTPTTHPIPTHPPPAGKLFPGPHLFAGVGITVLWAISAALVPAMQRGNDNARTAHIALNCVNLLLFASQVGTRACPGCGRGGAQHNLFEMGGLGMRG